MIYASLLVSSLASCNRPPVTTLVEIEYEPPTPVDELIEIDPESPTQLRALTGNDVAQCGLNNVEPLVSWIRQRGGEPVFSREFEPEPGPGVGEGTRRYFASLSATLTGEVNVALEATWEARAVDDTIQVERRNASVWVRAAESGEPQQEFSDPLPQNVDGLAAAVEPIALTCVGRDESLLDSRLAFVISRDWPPLPTTNQKAVAMFFEAEQARDEALAVLANRTGLKDDDEIRAQLKRAFDKYRELSDLDPSLAVVTFCGIARLLEESAGITRVRAAKRHSDAVREVLDEYLLDIEERALGLYARAEKLDAGPWTQLAVERSSALRPRVERGREAIASRPDRVQPALRLQQRERERLAFRCSADDVDIDTMQELSACRSHLDADTTPAVEPLDAKLRLVATKKRLVVKSGETIKIPMTLKNTSGGPITVDLAKQCSDVTKIERDGHSVLQPPQFDTYITAGRVGRFTLRARGRAKLSFDFTAVAMQPTFGGEGGLDEGTYHIEFEAPFLRAPGQCVTVGVNVVVTSGSGAAR